MARIRSVHPGLFTDEAFATVSPLARLLWIGIWTECDDRGAFEWKPITLKMRLLPADNADVPALLAELAAADMVRQYTVEGRNYGAVRNFARFQRPKKPNSTFPIPDEFRTYICLGRAGSEPDDDEGGESSPPHPASPARSSPPTTPSSATSSPPVPHQSPTSGEISPQMEDGGWRMEDGGSAVALPARASPPDAFEAWWRHYPRKVAKDDARKAYAAARKRGASDAELAAALHRQRWPEEPRFIPHASKWLNGGRWHDDPDAAAPPEAKSDRAWWADPNALTPRSDARQPFDIEAAAETAA